MDADRRSIVVNPCARELRRRLGPTAWVVLEELVSASQGHADDCYSAATVRSLAADLGLSKDTVARALVRLRTAGIIVAGQDRTPAGTFATGRYRISIPGAIELVQPEPPTTAATRPGAARPLGSQLALTLDWPKEQPVPEVGVTHSRICTLVLGVPRRRRWRCRRC